MNKVTHQGFKVAPYKFLSNMEPCRVYYYGLSFPSVENAYQAAKCQDYQDMLQFQTCNPYQAKKLGRKVRMRRDFANVKLSVMKYLLLQKFSFLNPSLRVQLTKTEGVQLIEYNNWGDTFYGVCNGKGENHLGRLLMEVREDLLAGKYGYSKRQWSMAESVYNKLGNKTVNPGSRIVIHKAYGRDGVRYSKSINGVFTLRVKDMRYHLGNPYTSHLDIAKRENLMLTENTKDAVIAYMCWVMFTFTERAVQIRKWLSDGSLKYKPIVYYKELGQPSHATALEYLIDNWGDLL